MSRDLRAITRLFLKDELFDIHRAYVRDMLDHIDLSSEELTEICRLVHSAEIIIAWPGDEALEK